MTVLKMTVDEWLVVPDNPRQRNTEARALRASHLKKLAPDHSHVSMAVAKGGKKWKLDGHTRAFLWSAGKLERPRGGLDVSVYHVDDEDAAAQLYTHFDNKRATKSACDDVHGGFREMGFTPQSSLLRGGRVTSGLKGALAVLRGHTTAKGNAAADIFDVIYEFAAELEALDRLMVSQNGMTGGEQAAFFVTYRKHGELVMPFWSSYFSGGGEKRGKTMDGVEALRQLVQIRKAAKTIAGGDNQFDVMARAVNCVERWLARDTVTQIKAIDLRDYLGKKKQKAA